MKKKWVINNGWNKLNACGQTVLCQIGPRDFDAHADWHEENAAVGGKRTAPYRRAGTAYIFDRKRDFDAAVARLRAAGMMP